MPGVAIVRLMDALQDRFRRLEKNCGKKVKECVAV
jgi:hypothetical protein